MKTRKGIWCPRWWSVSVFAVILVAAGASAPLASHNFADVPDGVFYHDFVQFLVDNGITAGCGGGNYCGDDAVTREQMAIFLRRLKDAVDTDVASGLVACPPDAVKVGPACIDTYEASVWHTTDAAVIQKIQLGTVTLADLTGAGATLVGATGDNYGTFGCPDTGNGCTDLYAVSIAGAQPARFLTWFQAAAIARNSGKRLPTNQEWQVAALGTPDNPADCVIDTVSGQLTGSSATCVSDVGAFDMVGNYWEWVGDLVAKSTGFPAPPMFPGTADRNLARDVDPADGPGAPIRGGFWGNPIGHAGVSAIETSRRPDQPASVLGFRAAR